MLPAEWKLIPAGVLAGWSLLSWSVENRSSAWWWKALSFIHCPVLVLRAFLELSQPPAANPFVPGHVTRHHNVDLYVPLRSCFFPLN